MAKAERPKSAMAILPVRPCRGSGKVAQTAFSSESRDGNSSIPTVNHFLGDLRIPKMHVLQNLFQESSVKYTTFRIAVVRRRMLPNVPPNSVWQRVRQESVRQKGVRQKLGGISYLIRCA